MFSRFLLLSLLVLPLASRAEDPALDPWRKAKVSVVSPATDHHVIHSYYVTCPESPDGKYVLYYTSATPVGETGDLRILERATGKETVLVSGIETEDAHRAACQSWSDNGRFVVYHEHIGPKWRVMAVEVATKEKKVLAEDYQIGFGSPTGVWVPIYGCHWNPGDHRDLVLVNVRTGEKKVSVSAAGMAKEYGDFIQKKLGSLDVSVFFPVVSPDESKVFLKITVPSYSDDFRTMKASNRDGKVVYDLKNDRFIRLIETWGHPAWTYDSKGIIEKANYITDIESGKVLPRFAPSCFSDHPALAPGGKVFSTDADVSKRYGMKEGTFGVAVGSTKEDDWVCVALFDNARGATSWRHNHPHPVFSADAQRLYFNQNDGEWTKLMVAEAQK